MGRRGQEPGAGAWGRMGSLALAMVSWKCLRHLMGNKEEAGSLCLESGSSLDQERTLGSYQQEGGLQ